MSDDKAREYIDKVNSGEIPMGSTEVRTERTDEGRVTSTTRGKCGPCNVGKHGDCQGKGVCDCDHPVHNQGQTM
jgi:hypothetical protein